MSDTLKFHEMFTDKFYFSSTIITHRIESDLRYNYIIYRSLSLLSFNNPFGIR